jgi:5'-AMP-activated protein kinase regulatory beta subunit
MAKQKGSKTKRRRITFQYENIGAKNVSLVGDFNDWDQKKHPMTNDGTGQWKKIILLIPGTYEYKFIVDGRWKKDPRNTETCLNSYGTRNSLLKVRPK